MQGGLGTFSCIYRGRFLFLLSILLFIQLVKMIGVLGASWLVYDTSSSLAEKQGLPAINQLLSWFILGNKSSLYLSLSLSLSRSLALFSNYSFRAIVTLSFPPL